MSLSDLRENIFFKNLTELNAIYDLSVDSPISFEITILLNML